MPAPILFPIACLGLGAQYCALREIWFPEKPQLLPPPEDGDVQTGWASLPDELLAAILMRLTVSTPGLLLRWSGSAQLRLVCRSWRRVHDSRAVLFLKPGMFYPELLVARFPSLMSLDLSRCKYPEEIGVRECLASLRQLESVTMKDVGVGPRLARTLAESLVASGRLRTLNLASNGVGRGCSSFADALRLTCCSLTVLTLRDNCVTAAGAVALADALRHNRSLEELDLSANPGVGCEGAVALGAALVRNSSLRSLNLGGCGLGDDGACALAQSLAGARGLRSLSLFTNSIGDAGAVELAAGAARSELESLELRGNPGIAAAGVRALAAAALANPKFRAVHVDACTPAAPGGRPSPGGGTPTAAQAAVAAELSAAAVQLASVLNFGD